MSDIKPLIILGASVRAAAQSALRAGFQPWCIDLFADRDLQHIATAKPCPPGEYPFGMLKLLESAPIAPVLITGALENYPDLLRAIEHDRPLWASTAAAIEAVRDPAVLTRISNIPGIAAPRSHTGSPLFNLTRRLRISTWRKRYLIKSLRSAAGNDVQFWSISTRVDREHYLQRYIDGKSISAVYHADGWSARLLGATTQIIGDEAFGATQPFQYCGSIGPLPLTDAQRRALTRLGVILAQQFDLRGLFGVDAVIARNQKKTIHPVEVNPRYTASVEVIERAMGIAAMAPPGKAPASTSRRAVHGKAIVFARSDGRAPDLYEMFDESQGADVPAIDSPLQVGKPICTLLAAGRDEPDCLDRLHELARRLYPRLRS